MAKTPTFSDDTIRFLKKAGRQKSTTWLDRNRDEYERVLLLPLQRLARELKSELASAAPGYHFPQKGIGRLKRPANRIGEGGGVYRSWMSYQATTPSGSRFDHNPNLFFMIDPHDAKEGVLVAGGLYMPSSRQLRSIREAIAEDASSFDRLFADRNFVKCFKGGFSHERKATRPPRGFDPQHPRIEWLKLQAYFVWRPYKKSEFKSPRFPKLVARDWEQILRLNVLLGQAIQGRLPKAESKPGKIRGSRFLERLSGFDAPARPMDF